MVDVQELLQEEEQTTELQAPAQIVSQSLFENFSVVLHCANLWWTWLICHLNAVAYLVMSSRKSGQRLPKLLPEMRWSNWWCEAADWKFEVVAQKLTDRVTFFYVRFWEILDRNRLKRIGQITQQIYRQCFGENWGLA